MKKNTKNQNGAFRTVWKTDAQGITTQDNQIFLPLIEQGLYDFQVTWGDGTRDTIQQWDDPAKLHTYDNPGTYDVVITGKFQGFSFLKKSKFLVIDDKAVVDTGNGDPNKLVRIEEWGPFELGKSEYSFFLCHNLTITAEDIPDLKSATSLAGMFSQCKLIEQIPNIEAWDVSHITDMHSMFSGCKLFNQDISGWDVSSVTDMSWMFHEAFQFNQDIGSWDVSSVKFMAGMFDRAHSFNQDIGGWDVSNVTKMSTMFAEAHSFNQYIGNWDVSNVTDMRGMFDFAVSFNQDIGKWDVSNVTAMGRMFYNAQSFNQNIGEWDVSCVKKMQSMFENAISFNQNLGGWNISQVDDMRGIFHGASLGVKNYSAILSGWKNLPVLQEGVGFEAGEARYSGDSAAMAREKLISEYDWQIQDGGIIT